MWNIFTDLVILPNDELYMFRVETNLRVYDVEN